MNNANRILFHEKWYPFIRLGNHMHIMTCHCFGGVKYAPLYIHSFQLLQPRRLLEAERFNIKYTNPFEITTVVDKLRYYRHKKALRQRDVAEKTGIHLVDKYNLFLYNGQGRQIRALRQSLGLTKKEFGKLYGFHVHTVNQWENDNIQILKSTWAKLFGNE
jgi:DNA-binding XRE family transcriptional regulator